MYVEHAVMQLKWTTTAFIWLTHEQESATFKQTQAVDIISQQESRQQKSGQSQHLLRFTVPNTNLFMLQETYTNYYNKLCIRTIAH